VNVDNGERALNRKAVVPKAKQSAKPAVKPAKKKWHRLQKKLRDMSAEEKREYARKRYNARKAEAAGNSGPATPKDIAVLEVLERTGPKIKKLKEVLGVEIPERK